MRRAFGRLTSTMRRRSDDAAPRCLTRMIATIHGKRRTTTRRGDDRRPAAPEISIITPCYNAVHHLRDAIESVRRQEGVRVEHIVVDAASKDGTVDLLREYPRRAMDFRTGPGTGGRLQQGARDGARPP